MQQASAIVFGADIQYTDSTAIPDAGGDYFVELDLFVCHG